MATIVYPKFIPASEWETLPVINSQEVLARMETPRWVMKNIWLGDGLTGVMLDGNLVLIQEVEPEAGFTYSINLFFFDESGFNPGPVETIEELLETGRSRWFDRNCLATTTTVVGYEPWLERNRTSIAVTYRGDVDVTLDILEVLLANYLPFTVDSGDQTPWMKALGVVGGGYHDYNAAAPEYFVGPTGVRRGRIHGRKHLKEVCNWVHFIEDDAYIYFDGTNWIQQDFRGNPCILDPRVAGERIAAAATAKQGLQTV